MSILRKLISVLLASIMLLSVFTVLPFTAGAVTTDTKSISKSSGNFEYEILFDGTVEITGYNGNASELEIPSKIDGYSVTSIGYCAFNCCTSLTNVIIPDSVKSIGESAFQECTNLKKAVIGNNVSYIGDSAFLNCKSLTNIIIPNSVKLLNDFVFFNCTSLTKVSIPDGVESIGSYTFSGCRKLTEAILPDSIKNIGSYAFEDCTDLTNITISNNIESIGRGALDDTAWYDNQPDGVLYIGKIAYKCKGYYCGDLLIKDDTKILADYAFSGYADLTSVTIPDSVTSIGECTFKDCVGLTNVKIGNSVTTIGDCAFYGCESLINIIIPNSVTRIGSSAFECCEGLKNVKIPDSVSEIGNSTFNNCINIINIEVDKNNSFYSSLNGNLYNKNQTKLLQYSVGKKDASFTIPSGVTSIGEWSFENCTNLISVTIPDTVMSIDAGAFADCRNLTDFTIPNSVTNIEYYAFVDCKKLKSITIPDSVKIIGDSSFKSCTGLTSVKIGRSVTSIDDHAFEDCKKLNKLIISNGVTSIQNYAFANCTSLKNVTIPKSVTSIDKYAFGYYSMGEFVKLNNFTIKGYGGTAAETYAKDNGYNFINLDRKTTINLKKSSGTVFVKGKTQIKTTVKNGFEKNTYKSKNTKIAKVNSKGLVTGIKKGKTTITVTNNGVSKNFKITVKNPKLNKSKKLLKKGNTFKLKIKGKVGIPKFISSNKKVAAVNSKGKITAKNKGNSIITVRTNGMKLKCKVSVK